jgi:hypothetical protein
MRKRGDTYVQFISKLMGSIGLLAISPIIYAPLRVPAIFFVKTYEWGLLYWLLSFPVLIVINVLFLEIFD